MCTEGETSPGDGLHTVSVACRNEAETKDIERYPDGDRTGRDQGSSNQPLFVTRPVTKLGDLNLARGSAGAAGGPGGGTGRRAGVAVRQVAQGLPENNP